MSSRTKSRRSPRRSTASKPAPRARQLMRQGWGRRDAEHLVVLELALTTVAVLDDEAAIRVLAEHAAIALAWPPVYAGALALYSDPSHSAAWGRLAAAAEGSARTSMFHLAAISNGRDVISVNRDELRDVVTDKDLQLHEAARLAEANGEFGKALELLSRAIGPLEDGWRLDLERLETHGATLPPAMWGRWICSAAVRFCLSRPVGLDLAQRYALVVLDALGVAVDELEQLVLPCVQGDQTVHDVVLFDEDGLAAFLDIRLSDTLAARVPGLASWPDAPPTVVRLERRLPEGDAVCRDLVTGATVIVGDLGLAAEQPVGSCFFGRLVSIDGDERRFFAMAPTIVDDLNAARLAASVRADEVPERRLAIGRRQLRSA